MGEHFLRVSVNARSDTTIAVHGRFPGAKAEGGLAVRVSWCCETSAGKFRAGLHFHREAEGAGHGRGEDLTVDPEDFDCYEALQLSPNADSETIDRVYRILAQRYHPDNSQSGNSETFIRVTRAHRNLNAAETRAGYDARHR